MKAVLLVLMAGLGLASETPPQVTGPTWMRTPLVTFPPEARGRLVEGRVFLNCLVLSDGSVRDCRIEREEPPGLGFGREALAASATFRLRPAMRSGAPIETRATVPVVFRASD